MAEKNPFFGVTYDGVRLIAERIAQCDFRVTASKYQSTDCCPWVLTVGESDWSRHVVVLAVTEIENAILVLLPAQQTLEEALHFKLAEVQHMISLNWLTADGYSSVKRILGPNTKTE